MEREILVYADLVGTSYLVGPLWTRSQGTRDSTSFEYGRAWLAQSVRLALDPAFQLA